MYVQLYIKFQYIFETGLNFFYFLLCYAIMTFFCVVIRVINNSD